MQITQYYVRAKTFQSSDSIKEGSSPDIWYYRLHESSRINLRMSGTLEAGKIKYCTSTLVTFTSKITSKKI